MDRLSRNNPAGLAFERVPSYRTSDGRLQATRDLARAREAEIAIVAFALEADSAVTEAEPSTPAEVSRELGNYLIANAERLLPLLEELTRKPKTPESIDPSRIIQPDAEEGGRRL